MESISHCGDNERGRLCVGIEHGKLAGNAAKTGFLSFVTPSQTPTHNTLANSAVALKTGRRHFQHCYDIATPLAPSISLSRISIQESGVLASEAHCPCLFPFSKTYFTFAVCCVTPQHTCRTVLLPRILLCESKVWSINKLRPNPAAGSYHSPEHLIPPYPMVHRVAARASLKMGFSLIGYPREDCRRTANTELPRAYFSYLISQGIFAQSAYTSFVGGRFHVKLRSDGRFPSHARGASASRSGFSACFEVVRC